MNNIIQITEEHLKKSARRLQTLLENKSCEQSYNQCLQILSQSLLSQPFEEIKANFFKAKEEQTQTFNPVLILCYGSESILTNNGHYIHQTSVGTDMEISEDSLVSMGKSIASENNTVLRQIHLPKILQEDWETEEVINLARMLGYFDYEKPLLELLEDSDTTILVNGHLSQYRLDGDWINDINSENYDTFEEKLEHCIWHIELTNLEFEKFEYFVSLKEIIEAQHTGGRDWTINLEDAQVFIEIKY